MGLFVYSKYRYELQKKKKDQQKKSAGECPLPQIFYLYLNQSQVLFNVNNPILVLTYLTAGRMDLKELKMG